MNKTGYLYDNRYLLHQTGPFHPEIPDRLVAIHKGIKKYGLLKYLIPIKAKEADLKWIELVHDSNYIAYFKEACFKKKRIFFYPDNQICENTYKVATLAVGGILKVIDKIMQNELDNAFCAIRPPGHHAERNEAMGFCFFNNVAIAAKYLIKKWNIKRVGIIDFDVHHGNGTQNIFEENSKVFYCSIHQHPSFSFPGTGQDLDMGSQSGYGFTKNCTVLPGEGDTLYKKILIKKILPSFEKFKPEVLLISTGFDAHINDNMSDINLTTKGFSFITKNILKIANRFSKGRLISILEGGYCLKKLPELASNHIKILLEK